MPLLPGHVAASGGPRASVSGEQHCIVKGSGRKASGHTQFGATAGGDGQQVEEDGYRR
jgi:hypothetical protein